MYISKIKVCAEVLEACCKLGDGFVHIERSEVGEDIVGTEAERGFEDDSWSGLVLSHRQYHAGSLILTRTAYRPWLVDW